MGAGLHDRSMSAQPSMESEHGNCMHLASPAGVIRSRCSGWPAPASERSGGRGHTRKG